MLTAVIAILENFKLSIKRKRYKMGIIVRTLIFILGLVHVLRCSPVGSVKELTAVAHPSTNYDMGSADGKAELTRLKLKQEQLENEVATLRKDLDELVSMKGPSVDYLSGGHNIVRRCKYFWTFGTNQNVRLLYVESKDVCAYI